MSLAEMEAFVEMQMSTEDSAYGILKKTCLCNLEDGRTHCLLRYFPSRSSSITEEEYKKEKVIKEKKEKCCQICRQLLLSDLPPIIVVGKGKVWYREKDLDTKIDEILNLEQKLEIKEEKIWEKLAEGFSVVMIPVTYFSVMGHWSVIMEPYVGFRDDRWWERLDKPERLICYLLSQNQMEEIDWEMVMGLLRLALPSSGELRRIGEKKLRNFKSEVLNKKKFFLETQIGL